MSESKLVYSIITSKKGQHDCKGVGYEWYRTATLNGAYQSQEKMYSIVAQCGCNCEFEIKELFQ